MPGELPRVLLSVGLMAVGITAINSVSIPTLLSCLSLFCMQNSTSDLLCPVNAPCSPAPPHLLLLPAAPGPAQAPQMPLFTLQRRCHIPVSSPPVILCLASEGRHWSSSPVMPSVCPSELAACPPACRVSSLSVQGGRHCCGKTTL